MACHSPGLHHHHHFVVQEARTLVIASGRSRTRQMRGCWHWYYCSLGIDPVAGGRSSDAPCGHASVIVNLTIRLSTNMHLNEIVDG